MDEIYKSECKKLCWICPYNNKCITQKIREQEVKTFFVGTKNQQRVKSE